MKKIWKAFLATALALAMLTTVACGGKTDYDGTEVQGVTDTEILVGNTAGTSGTLMSIGGPFKAAMEAYFWYYNQPAKTAAEDMAVTGLADGGGKGGYEGKKIRYIHYDDQGVDTVTMTDKLINDDKVFAIVGHFGTDGVVATLDDIKAKGIPMVYAASGVSALYNEEAKGYERAVMPVQPIYETEGRLMLARAVADTKDEILYGLKATKVGVLNTSDDAGRGMKRGIEIQAKEMGVSVEYQEASAASGTDYSAAVTALKNKGCDVVIVATVAPFANVLKAMKAANFDAKVLTTYSNAGAQTLADLATEGSITVNRPVYYSGWVDNTSATGYVDYLKLCMIFQAYDLAHNIALVENPYVPGVYLSAKALDAYAFAGYIAADVFCQGLDRVKAADLELTWKNYVDQMESAEIVIPMGSGAKLDYSEGKRLGTTYLNLSKFDGTGAAAKVSDMMSLDDIVASMA